MRTAGSEGEQVWGADLPAHGPVVVPGDGRKHELNAPAG